MNSGIYSQNQRLFFSWNEMERKGKAMDKEKVDSVLNKYFSITCCIS